MIEASEIFSRIRFVLNRNQIRPDVERMFDAADCEWECAAAVCKSDTELREPFENAAKDHRADSQRRLSRHADEPWQPIFWHALLAEHVPRMNEDRRAELLRCIPDGLE